MILAPLVWLASSALGPSHRESRTLAGSLPRIAADPDSFLAFILLGLLSHALLIPAVLGVAHLIKGRRPTLAFVGAALVIGSSGSSVSLSSRVSSSCNTR